MGKHSFILTKKSPSSDRRGSLQVNPSYGDVPHLFGGASIPICPKLNEASSAKVDKKIQYTTQVLLKNIDAYENHQYHFDFNATKEELFRQICNLFRLRKDKNSKYGTYVFNGNQIICFRFANHDCFGDNFSDENALNISVFVSYIYLSNKGFSQTPYEEWEITPEMFESNPENVISAMCAKSYLR